MGYLHASRGRGSRSARGAIFGGVVLLHGLVAYALTHADVRQRLTLEAPPVEVVFLQEEQQQVAPPPPRVAMAPVPVLDLALPIVDAPPSDAPALTAITVMRRQESAPTVADTDVPVVVDEVDYMRPPAPRYPAAAKRARVQGTVLLRVLIDTEGRPREVRVHRSSGSEQLDGAARESVLTALFRPHVENGVPRAAQVIIPIEFSLHIRTARR
jgi:protein TonB